MEKDSLWVKWCHSGWLYTIYTIGIMFLILTIINWQNWAVPTKLLAILCVLLPVHVFEENTWPNGFHYTMNVVRGSKSPNEGPMNELTDMISNFGGELFFIALFLLKGNITTTIFVCIFGVAECIAHTVFGIIACRKLDRKVSVYNPGLLTAWLTLFPLSVYGIFWLNSQTITAGKIWGAIGLTAIVIVCLILLPIQLLGKYQPQYVFSSNGYYAKLDS